MSAGALLFSRPDVCRWKRRSLEVSTFVHLADEQTIELMHWSCYDLKLLVGKVWCNFVPQQRNLNHWEMLIACCLRRAPSASSVWWHWSTACVTDGEDMHHAWLRPAQYSITVTAAWGCKSVHLYWTHRNLGSTIHLWPDSLSVHLPRTIYTAAKCWIVSKYSADTLQRTVLEVKTKHMDKATAVTQSGKAKAIRMYLNNNITARMWPAGQYVAWLARQPLQETSLHDILMQAQANWGFNQVQKHGNSNSKLQGYLMCHSAKQYLHDIARHVTMLRAHWYC